MAVNYESAEKSDAHAFNDTSDMLMLYYPDYSQNGIVLGILLAVYISVIAGTVVGNVLLLITWFSRKRTVNSKDFLLCSLAVSDLLVGIFVAPAKLLELTAPAKLSIFGEGLCTVLLFSQALTIFSTIMSLLMVTAERYLVIVHPLKVRRWKRSTRMVVLLVGSWLSALLLSSPNLSKAQVHRLDAVLISQWGTLDRAGCVDSFDDLYPPHFRQGYFLFLFLMLYVMPVILIAFFNGRIVTILYSPESPTSSCSDPFNSSYYSKVDRPRKQQSTSRKRVAVMMVLVHVTFIVCWSPYFLTTIINEYFYDFFGQGHFYFIMLCINASGFLNSALNPIIMFLMMAPRFRKECRDTLKAACCCQQRCCASWKETLHLTAFATTTASQALSDRRNYGSRGGKHDVGCAPQPGVADHHPGSSTLTFSSQLSGNVQCSRSRQSSSRSTNSSVLTVCSTASSPVSTFSSRLLVIPLCSSGSFRGDHSAMGSRSRIQSVCKTICVELADTTKTVVQIEADTDDGVSQEGPRNDRLVTRKSDNIHAPVIDCSVTPGATKVVKELHGRPVEVNPPRLLKPCRAHSCRF